MQYRPEIDGLRAIAVVPVILFHAGVSVFSGGYVGVDIFFVISGYLITSIIFSEILEKRFSLVDFYERRARRILPALFVVMLVSIPFAYTILLPSHLVDFGESLAAVPLFLSNVLFWSERGYFGVETELKPLVHTWSLAVEEQFYLVYPLVLWAVVTFARRFLFGLLSAVMAMSLTLSWYLSHIHFETGFYLPFARAWELLAGAFAAFLIHKSVVPSSRVGNGLSALGLMLIGYAILSFDESTLFPGTAAIVPVLGAFLIIISGSENNVTHRLLSSRPFIYTGLISYSLYLWHQPIFAFIRHLDWGTSVLYLSIPLVFLCAYASYRWVEQPFRNRSRLNRPKVFQMSAISSLAMIVIGLVFVANKGFINRFDQHDAAILNQFTDVEEYNATRFESLMMKPFQDDPRKKILLVGDSYARDFVNIMFEGGLDQKFQFSTKQINSECGNLHVDDDLSPYMQPGREERCRVIGRFESPEVKALASLSDEIWLVSCWRSWVPKFLPETVANLEREFGKKVRIFGLKDYGRLSQQKIMRIDAEEREDYEVAVKPISWDVNEEMKDLLSEEHFVELLDLFCSGDAKSCRIFTDKVELISPDGGHLTPAGARYLARKIEPVLNRFLN